VWVLKCQGGVGAKPSLQTALWNRRGTRIFSRPAQGPLCRRCGHRVGHSTCAVSAVVFANRLYLPPTYM
jgi:hypothetical protein